VHASGCRAGRACSCMAYNALAPLRTFTVEFSLEKQGVTGEGRASPRKATMASRPCLSSASFSLKVRASSPPDVRPRGSK
jgi:hypothetical protein